MKEVTVSDAIGHVRRCLDELEPNGSAMMGADMDNAAIDIITAKCLPEAIEYIHRSAPLTVLDGLTAGREDMEVTVEGLVVTVRMLVEIDRLLYIKSSDSEHMVTSAVEEDSPYARMQLNRYTRGTFDNPAVVLVRTESSGLMPSYRYYSLKEQDPAPVFSVGYIPHQGNQHQQSYMVADAAVNMMKYQLTGMVLSSYGEYERAKIYFDMSNSWGDK